MIAVFSDTHSNGGHELAGAALDAAQEADVVLHAGDFTAESALEAFRETCDQLFAVHGNADNAPVRDRLPEARTVAAEGVRIALTHRREGGATGLTMFGRSRGADVVVSGHSHQPSVVRTDDVLLLNPGSHDQPRGNRPGFARLETATTGVSGDLCEPDGTTIESFDLKP